MRIALLLALSLAAAACGAKKSPAAPTSPAATESAPAEEEKGERSLANPDDADDARDESAADPCDGGE